MHRVSLHNYFKNYRRRSSCACRDDIYFDFLKVVREITNNYDLRPKKSVAIVIWDPGG